jgi:hypothetical protein
VADAVIRAEISLSVYTALLAYVARNEPSHQALNRLRTVIRDHWRVATCVGFGPRVLHSTGQVYKDGLNSGVFVQITHEDAGDLALPGHAFDFSVVKNAQTRGDFEVPATRRRRAVRVRLRGESRQGSSS